MSKQDENLAGELGRRIRRLRQSRGMTQEDLAKAACLDRTTIGAAESGRRDMETLTLMLIAGGLEVMPREIVDGIEWVPSSSQDGSGTWRSEPPPKGRS